MTVLVLRYVIVAILNLGASVFLIRRLGAEAWASYSVALFIVTFVDQQLGARLLAGLHVRVALSETLVSAAAAVSQRTAGICLLLLIPGAWAATELSALPGIGHTILAAAACTCIYSWRALPVALLERQLAFRSVAAGEVLDQVTFLSIAVPAVALGAGLEAISAALAVRGVPTLILLRLKVRAPWFGGAGPDVRRVLAFALPGSITALCFFVEGLLPLILLGGDHPTLVGFVMTAASLVSYPAVLVLVIPRIALPVLSRVRETPRAFARAVDEVALATAACLTASVGGVAVLSPWWLSTVLGAEWKTAWPQVAGMAGSYILMGPINVAMSALLALHKARQAAVVSLAMLSSWVLGAIVLVSLSATRWVLVALIASKGLGFGLALPLATRGGISHTARTFAGSICAIVAVYAGAASLADGLIVAASVSAAFVFALSAWMTFGSRRVLRVTWASFRTRLSLPRRIANDDDRAGANNAGM